MTVRFFCNIGWMMHYEGVTDTDSIVGGGTHVDNYETGGEVCNFVRHGNYVYGFVQAPKGRREDGDWRDLKLERLGAKKADAKIEGVTIIWTARRPGAGRVVIGWYNDATLYRRYQQLPVLPALYRKNDLEGWYNVRARVSDVKLLPVDERVVLIPREKGGFGQSNIWYADTKKGKKIAAKIIKELKNSIKTANKKRVMKKSRRRYQIDQLLKRKVEKAAIEAVWQYYENKGYVLDTVEQLNLGWDLEATLQDITLRIEVKGLSAKDGNIELTPNEYKAFKSKHPDYRLGVVTVALKKPKLGIFRFHKPTRGWLEEISEKFKLGIKTRQSASASMIRI